MARNASAGSTASDDVIGAERLGGPDLGSTHDVTREVRPVVRSEPRPIPTTTSVELPPDRRDQVRWGPVWAGLAVALSTFLFLEVLFFAFGWLTPGSNNAGVDRPLVTAILGLVSFFIGGLVAAATSMWRGTGSGFIQGVVVWAAGVVSVLLIALLGGASLFGSLADVVNQTDVINSADINSVDTDVAISTLRDAAGWTALGLGAALLASVLGGLLGAKIWPRKATGAHSVRLP